MSSIFNIAAVFLSLIAYADTVIDLLPEGKEMGKSNGAVVF